VVDHGIDATVIENLRQEMHAFFAQPQADKRATFRTADNPWGFFDQELTKNTPDWKQIYDVGPADGVIVPQWPQTLPRFRPALLRFYEACEELALRLTAAISTNLGMPAEHLGSNFADTHTSFVRLNYYPPCPTPECPEGISTPSAGHLGVNHHTDAGVLTLLLQDGQPGLEVFRDGCWHLVEARSDALVINIGDIVQVWSNDRYRAALHRVIANAEVARYSAPFFFNPAYDTNYAPLSSTIDTANPPRYRTINWGEFRALRAAGDYADRGDEIQISHYSI
jgi:isopenicillin N synthase-like dioxygenase